MARITFTNRGYNAMEFSNLTYNEEPHAKTRAVARALPVEPTRSAEHLHIDAEEGLSPKDHLGAQLTILVVAYLTIFFALGSL